MILEVADITVHAESADGFADAVAKGLELLAETPGFVSARLTRSHETPTRFLLLVDWESIEAHNVNFRQSERFPRWRAIIGPFLDGPIHVEHVEAVVTHGG